MTQTFIDNRPHRDRAVIVDPIIAKSKPNASSRANATRDEAARLEEAIGLALAIDLDIVSSLGFRVRELNASTLFGRGKIEEISEICEKLEVSLCVINTSLTPIQQRNLERALGVKVIDRTGLILEIFGRRARTNEGKLQVDLARLNYDKSRLVRTWTHLERQRATGKTGGPGETQIELDRRIIADQIKALKAELDEVKRTRQMHRDARSRVPYPIVALVGYTNAGKSTLFNRLTHAEVVAKDMLFATLDTTLRTLKLPNGRSAILSDTVGFISDLPHELVAAFRATLEEVIEADIILHVRDMANEDSEAQKFDVETVLNTIHPEMDPNSFIEVWNKVDLLSDEAKDILKIRALSNPSPHRPLVISSLSGEGIEALLNAIAAAVDQDGHEIRVKLKPNEGRRLAFLYQHGRVVDRHEDEEGSIHLVVKLDEQAFGRFQQLSLKET